jgi:hypothetical protein
VASLHLSLGVPELGKLSKTRRRGAVFGSLYMYLHLW